jgi:uncharacterized protein YecT (DUF1311 family)
MIRVLFLIILFSFNGIALAENTMMLKGKYELRADAESLEMIGDFVCFYPDSSSAKLLPRSAKDVRIPWFCFNSSIEAKKLLGISLTEDKTSCGVSGSAVVKVKDYKVALEEGEQFDTATLILAKDNVNQKTISCMTTEQHQTNTPTVNKFDSMYDSCLKEAGVVNNTSVTDCATKTSAKAKAEINTLYRKTYQQMLSKSPENAAKFEQSQKSWVTYRNTHCELATAYIGSPMVAYCPMKLNILRVNELLALSGQ